MLGLILRTICIVGAGYVGLVTGTCFAELGNHVICVDSDQTKVDALRRGVVPFFEPGLEELVNRNINSGRLRFESSIHTALRDAQVIFIAVGTPMGDDGHADLSYVRSAAREIAHALVAPLIVVNKSTVPVETGDLVASIIREQQSTAFDVHVVSNPEFLREGSAIADFMKPDRIVLGVDNPEAEAVMRDLYAPLEAKIIATDVRTAEMIKYAANCFLATKISFINEIAEICENVGADIKDVVAGIGSDERIGTSFLNAGLGFGGSCFPKDVMALSKIAESRRIPARILESVLAVNRDQVTNIVTKIGVRLGGIDGKRLAVLGLSFKPNTDDLRESQAMNLIRALSDGGATIVAHDPVAIEKARIELANIGNVTFVPSLYECVNDADSMILATEWNEYRQVDFDVIRKLMRGDLIVDTRNVYDPSKLGELGFRYIGVGRKGYVAPVVRETVIARS